VPVPLFERDWPCWHIAQINVYLITSQTLHHTATHGDTLQHAATHCRYVCIFLMALLMAFCKLQHTATHCNTLQYTANISNKHSYVSDERILSLNIHTHAHFAFTNAGAHVLAHAHTHTQTHTHAHTHAPPSPHHTHTHTQRESLRAWTGCRSPSRVKNEKKSSNLNLYCPQILKNPSVLFSVDGIRGGCG